MMSNPDKLEYTLQLGHNSKKKARCGARTRNLLIDLI